MYHALNTVLLLLLLLLLLVSLEREAHLKQKNLSQTDVMERLKNAERVNLACSEREIPLWVFIPFSMITLAMKWLHTELCCVIRIYIKIKPSRSGKENSKPKKIKPRTCCCNGSIFLSKYVVKDTNLVMQQGLSRRNIRTVRSWRLYFGIFASSVSFMLFVEIFLRWQNKIVGCCLESVSLTCNWKIDLSSSSGWTVFQANHKKEKNK